MSGRLQDRIALITGSSSGIGRATAFAYAREGAKLVCADINEGTWREDAPKDEFNGPTHQRIKDMGGQAIFVHCDVSDSKSVENAVQSAVREWGRLDIMINNAGFAMESRAPKPIWETPLDLFHRTTAVNINGVFYGIKYASAQMITQTPLPNANGDRGWILNAASVFGLNGVENASAYCTSKGAVANLTKAAALDCAPYRVHVNAVCPGFVHTHMTDEIFKDAEKGGQGQGDMVDALHPFRGRGLPEDVARAYVFLASEEAGWMTGVNMPVDGGFNAR
ncbi:related to dehydrogenases with different specificities (related to short-chain alcohol [Lecanosticta acicola]|uniref:Related to dehydrogenases with different specificities (related to short-chain alcohol) n=1 Tax=Lecanosticta acicola TaxID=111012 RepID=A0AAI8Z477_9PEZI|nr:related to dehydrogenases with different specificities (related to short-chain alcohol [Lecanosticta acicola]